MTSHPRFITIPLLRNSEIHLISWLDFSEEHIGGTLGSTSAPTATCRSPIATTAGRGYIFSLCMVSVERFELSTIRLKVECATAAPHAHNYFISFLTFYKYYIIIFIKNQKYNMYCGNGTLHAPQGSLYLYTAPNPLLSGK